MKWLLWLVVAIIILFGIYRREYLSQAIPVYMQYLEQRSKWERVNTGTYAYYSPTLYTYYFIKDNKLAKIMRYGYPYDVKFVRDFNQSIYYKRKKESKDIECFFNNKEYLIDKRFDAVRRLVLVEGMVGDYASLTRCRFNFDFHDFVRTIDDKYSYIIGYNARYGYPMEILDIKSKYLSYAPHFVQDFVMLPAKTDFTPKVLKEILKYFQKQYRMRHNNKMTTIKAINIKGGNLIKSAILKPVAIENTKAME